MKKIRYILLLCCTLFLFFESVSQNSKMADSLIRVLNSTTVDSVKVKLYGDISWELMSADINKALEFAQKELELSIKIDSKKDIAQAESDIGNIYNRKGSFNEALDHYYKALELRKTLGHKVKMAGIYSNIATVLMRQNKQKEALDIYFKSLKIFEEIGDENKQCILLGNIGNLYFNLDRNKEALFYFNKGLALAKKVKNRSIEGNILVNIADVYFDDKNYSSAEYHFLQALKIYDELGDKYSSASVYNNLGNISGLRGEFNKAISNYNLSIEIRKELQDSFGLAQSHIQIGEFFINNKRHKEALPHLVISENIFTKTNSIIQRERVYNLLSECYEHLNDYTNALKYKKSQLTVKDSIYFKDFSQQLTEMNTKYDTEKKEQENKLLSAKNDLSQETIKRQKIFSYFIVTALLLAAGLAFFIFRGLKQQRVANKMISLQKQQVEHKNHIIEEKQKEILDSINYAKRIQYALLANDDFLNKYIPSHFVLFKPKDIVSGDFYWATQIHNKQNEDLFYLAVCDSTGHGVPGAFMSLLSIGFLSEAIKEKDIFEPNQVFNYVRKRLVDSISNEQQKDGFDGILMCFNKTTGIVTYAASNNKPVLVNASGTELIELQCDKMPVGKGDKTESFSLFTLNYQKGDSVYLYTDGYADQFGGPKGKKFKYKQLEDILQQNSAKPLVEQKEILSQRFANWQGALEQVDDVCVIGIKLI